jgi:hypothetical protein
MPRAMQVWPPAKPLSPPTDPMQRERAVLRAWCLEFLWSLELGAWNFVGFATAAVRGYMAIGYSPKAQLTAKRIERIID